MPLTLLMSNRNKSRFRRARETVKYMGIFTMTSCVSSFTAPPGAAICRTTTRDEHLVTDVVHVHDDLCGQRFDEFAVKKSDHAWFKFFSAA